MINIGAIIASQAAMNTAVRTAIMSSEKRKKQQEQEQNNVIENDNEQKKTNIKND